MAYSKEDRSSGAVRWRLMLAQAWLARVRRQLAALALRPRRALPAAALALTLSAGGFHAIQAAPNATIVVAAGASGMTAGDGCSFVEAVVNANSDSQSGSTECVAGSGADTIQLPAAATLGYSQFFNNHPDLGFSIINVSSSMTIEGNGSTLQRSASLFRLLAVTNPDTVLTINNLALDRGHTAGTGSRSTWGGAIIVDGASVTLNNCIISNNAADQSGGGLAVRNLGTVTLNNCTVNNNVAGYDGGGLYSHSGNLTINKSTIRNNRADDSSGGVEFVAGSTVSISDSTINNNSPYAYARH